MKLSTKQLEIVKIYANLASKNKKFPANADMIRAGIARVRDHLGSLENLKEEAQKLHPEKFEFANKKKNPHKHQDFTKEALGSIIKENDYKEGTFFVTAVSPTSHLDWSEEDHVRAENGEDVLAENLFKPGWDAIQNYIGREKAELVILPMPAHVKALQEQPLHYDPTLKPFKSSFATEFTFNDHLKAIEAYINPQQANPITGFKRLRVSKYNANGSQGEEIKRLKTSIVVAHSKQMLEVVPTGNESHPRLIHSTGAITLPSYLRNRVGMIANEDHLLGGLIIEIKDDKFWMRQVQFDAKNGSFIDCGKRYHADGSMTRERAEAFKMGDLHPGLHHSGAIEGMYKLWEEINPKRIFFEDFFDGASISHWSETKRLTRAQLPNHFRDLPTEIEMAKKVLSDIWDKAPKDAQLIATASNHPEHVQRYLDEGRYIRDCKENYAIAHRMVVMALDGKNPLQEYLDPDNRMTWTDENEDFFVEGCQFNSHGHLGIGGARGSLPGHELAYGSSMSAHTHKPGIYHGAFMVGHKTTDRHGYNSGPQNWVRADGAIFKGGHKQIYMYIDNSPFRPKEKKKKKK